MVDIGDAKLIVTADTERAEGKLRAFGNSAEKMSGKMRKMGIAMVAVGLAIAGAMVKMTMSWAKAGDEVAKMSKRIGASTEWLSKMRYAAEISGTSLEGVEKAFKRFAKTLDDAKLGLETYTREFERLGIGLEELEGMKPEDAFMRVALAIAEIEDPLERAAAAQNMFGRSGAELLPLLAEGADGIEALMQKAEELGIVFDAEAAVAAEKFNDSITTLKTALMGMGAVIAETIAPSLTAFIEKAGEAIKKVKEWIDANPILVEGLMALAGILGVGGALLIAFSMIKKAIMAVNVALVIMHSLTGIGLLKVIAGLAAAAGIIYGMQKLAAIPAGELPKPPIKLPGMQYGGIVPGPFGRPVPIIAHGGERFAGIGRGLGNTYNLTLQSQVFMGNEADALGYAQEILDNIRLLEERTTGVSA